MSTLRKGSHREWRLAAAISAALLLPTGLEAQVTKQIDSPRVQIVHFDLPSLPLATVLLEFALQADVDIVVAQDLVKGHYSSPVVGRLAPAKALTQILSKTNLSFRYLPNTQTILIEPGKPKDEEVAATSEPTKEYDRIEETVVTGARFPFRYTTITESSQVHGNLSSFDTARFFNVLPDQVLVDQQPTNLIDALRNSSSLSPGDGLAGSNDDFFIRGFPRNALYVDQFRLGTDSGTKLSMVGIESVEIIKGPSTIDFGQAEPGGVVNVVRKMPEYEREHTLGSTFGEGGRQTYNLDSTGATFGKSDVLLYRFIAETHVQDENQEFSEIEQTYLSPKLRFNISNSLSLDLGYDYYDSSHIRDQRTIILVPNEFGELDLKALDIPVNQQQPEVESEFHLASAKLSKSFTSGWWFNASYFLQHEEREGVRVTLDNLLASNVFFGSNDVVSDDDEIIPITFSNGVVLDVAVPQTSVVGGSFNGLIPAAVNSVYDEEGYTTAQVSSLSFEGSSNVGSTTHHLKFGIDARIEESELSLTLEDRDDFATIDLTNTNDVQVVLNPDAAQGELTRRINALEYFDMGIFLQDNIEFSQHFLLSGGLRFTHTEGDSFNISSNESKRLAEYNEVSSQLGSVFKPSDSVSLYLSYSEAMKPNYVIDDFDSEITEPELSNQKEAGIKALIFDHHLLLASSVFQIEKENIVSTEFLAGQRRSVITNAQTVTGLDFDFTFQATKHLDIMGSLSLLDSEVTEGEFMGKTPALVSDSTASLFMNYQLDRLEIGDAAINFGVYYIGDRYSDQDNNFVLEKFATVDLGLWYKIPTQNSQWTLQLSAKNITDEEYIASSEGNFRTTLGQGRSINTSIRLLF